MDILERRLREVFAVLLSQGAKVLERTAGELEQAADELRPVRDRRGADAEDVWDDPASGRPEPVVRGAPLRAVPDTPTDAPPTPAGGPTTDVPPERPPTMPEDAVTGDVDAAGVASPSVTEPTIVDDAAPGAPPAPPDDERAAVTSSPTAAAPSVEQSKPAIGSERAQQLSSATVAEIRAQLGDLSVEELRDLREVELANRNRSTVITAIDRALRATD
jgi:hypothetical protein